MKNLLLLLLKNRSKSNGSQTTAANQGFTMIELLIGAIMAVLIITPLMGFVVDLLNDDNRETAKTAGEQEIQAALDFIAEDVAQAVHIYDADGVEELTEVGSPILPEVDDGTPILVFWKRKLEPGSVRPASEPTLNCEDNPENCDDRLVLSLVAYYLVNDNNPIWCPEDDNCPARISRYELSGGGPNRENPRPDPGFPTNIDLLNAPNNIEAAPGETITQGTEVLINYVDASQGGDVPALENEECVNSLGQNDDTLANIGFDNSGAAEDAFRIVDEEINSFYACVITSRKTAYVYIRGNALRRIKTNNTEYTDNRRAYFPEGSAIIGGGSQLGQ
jgi:type II secretory pathway pseudopilin PulG